MWKLAAFLFVLSMITEAAVVIEKVEYQGWPNSYRISNGEVELVVTGDIGPRIMRYAFVGGRNLFKEFPETLGKSGEPEWVPRGGHRIWAAPEDAVKTYAPDNAPVKVVAGGGALEATQPVEELTGLEKHIAVKLAPSGSAVEVTHRIRNLGPKPVELAAWALTMMAQGGVGIHGFPPRGTHPEVLAPTNPLVMWAFTDLADPRWKFTKKYLTLRQDPHNAAPQKLGTFNPQTWGAYLLGTDLYVKRYQATAGAPGAFADMGCTFEIFTNGDFLELETLGPLVRLARGASLTHVETWELHRDVKIARWDDAELDRVLAPLAGAR
jgi:hypothetical protein